MSENLFWPPFLNRIFLFFKFYFKNVNFKAFWSKVTPNYQKKKKHMVDAHFCLCWGYYIRVRQPCGDPIYRLELEALRDFYLVVLYSPSKTFKDVFSAILFFLCCVVFFPWREATDSRLKVNQFKKWSWCKRLELTGGNWQKWKRVFLTCPCHEIYRDEAVGLKSCKNTWKITIFVKMWNLGQYRENLIFCQ